jgi:hypothetical protein
VFGYEAHSIKHLELYLGLIDCAYVPILSRSLSPTLHTLDLDFEEEEESGVCYSILDEFFSQCQGIRNLKLQGFDFGDDHAHISQNISDGFYRLSQLSLEWCRGDLRMFVVSVPIPNLRSFGNFYWFGNRDISMSVAINYPTIERLLLSDDYDSSATLLKFVECCRGIEELSFFSDEMKLTRSDIEAIASLPRLKSLNIRCRIAEDAVSALSRCRGLKHLALGRESFDLTSILPNIGRRLVSLDYVSSTSIMGTVNFIVEHCLNLQILDLRWIEREDANRAVAVDSLKRGLKQLSKLKLNHKSVRLGTDWEGYR